jgi:hypothetical protein
LPDARVAEVAPVNWRTSILPTPLSPDTRTTLVILPALSRVMRSLSASVAWQPSSAFSSAAASSPSLPHPAMVK